MGKMFARVPESILFLGVGKWLSVGVSIYSFILILNQLITLSFLLLPFWPMLEQFATLIGNSWTISIKKIALTKLMNALSSSRSSFTKIQNNVSNIKRWRTANKQLAKWLSNHKYEFNGNGWI